MVNTQLEQAGNVRFTQTVMPPEAVDTFITSLAADPGFGSAVQHVRTDDQVAAMPVVSFELPAAHGQAPERVTEAVRWYAAIAFNRHTIAFAS